MKSDITKYINVYGAKENNLKNINVSIPKNKLVIVTGVSGSGKSTLAFDTLYQEGQRRYIESLSSYARQFLGNFEKPNVDKIEGLSPSIAIDQKVQFLTPAQLWVHKLRFTTTSDYFLHQSANLLL